ncbi:MAG: 4Fe-4S dicluster domain-containing protein [Desulfatiglandales bacterium]
MQYGTYVTEKDRLLPWLNDLGRTYRLVGPVHEGGYAAFREIDSIDDIALDYGPTMSGPQTYLYHLTEKLCTIHRHDGGFHVEKPEAPPPQVLLGVRSCDLHAVLVLDKVFLGAGIQDSNYRLWRRNTLLMGYHCTCVHPQCFCASMGTGPLFEPRIGYDFLFTDLGDLYLVEILGDRAHQLISGLRPEKADGAHLRKRKELRLNLRSQFTKKIETEGLVEVILANQDHPVWRQTAEERCLGCTNCTMVCPTCFCYNPRDHVSFDLKHCDRVRYKDSCQELHFAEVYGGNFRGTRQARLRQFVTHKLATWWEQFGCFGCVGCGRCMTWCPTKIDLTEIAKEIMRQESGPDKKPAKRTRNS